MLDLIKKSFNWLKSVWFIGSNLIKVVKGQEEIKQRLDTIEKDIKSPQYQVAELEKIQKNTDLLKEHYELEIKKLKTGNQDEIDKHKAKIGELTSIITGLNEYKELVEKAIIVIKQKDLRIQELNKEIEQFKQKTPPILGRTLLTSGFEYPYSQPISLGEALANSILGKKPEE